MNTITPVGLSSCRMTSSPAGDDVPEGLLRLADHCPEPPSFAFHEFGASVTAVVPPDRQEKPLSFVAASNRREQARRRPHCRAA